MIVFHTKKKKKKKFDCFVDLQAINSTSLKTKILKKPIEPNSLKSGKHRQRRDSIV